MFPGIEDGWHRCTSGTGLPKTKDYRDEWPGGSNVSGYFSREPDLPATGGMDGTKSSWQRQVRRVQRNGESIRKEPIIAEEVMERW